VCACDIQEIALGVVNVRETEAEAVAFVVCHALGLETGSGSTDCIQPYHGAAKLLQESLEVVQRTAAQTLGPSVLADNTAVSKEIARELPLIGS
jgi:hypothetical protein